MQLKSLSSDQVECELAKSWYARPSALLHAFYDERREASRRRDARLTMWAAVLIYIGFAAMDFVLIADVAAATATVRLAFGLGAFAIVEFLFRRGDDAHLIDTVCAFIVILCYLGWLVAAMPSRNGDALSLYLIFGTIFMMVANLIFNFRFGLSAVCSIAIVVVGIFATMAAPAEDPAYRIVFSTFYFGTFVATLYVNFKLNRERYNVFLHAVQAEIRREKIAERGEALLRLSNTDALTGLRNRRAIDGALRGHWDDWRSDRTDFTAILIDIDFFKTFNDHYGHQEGDRCLSLVAEALSATVSARGGVVGRYGGEEFIVIETLGAEGSVATLADDLRRVVECLQLPHEHRPDGERVITVSVGAASAAQLGSDRLERLISEADRALYRAKANGRNRSWIFDPNGDSRDESEDVAFVLQTAIEDGLVSLVYQPIFEPVSGRLAAAEALMRLSMPDGRSISPAMFIPIAERTGLIVELGRWAIRTACREIIARDLAPLVSVNVSALQLRAKGFALSVAAILAETDVPARRLAFEITESREIEKHSGVMKSIGELQRLGVAIWLDDFGTGFAGLSCLKAIDFDLVKIDRSFLNDSDDEIGAAMLADIVALIVHRGPKVVVEGVETARQLEILATLGVPFAQGFHLGRPASALGFHRNGGRFETAVRAECAEGGRPRR